MHSNTESGSEGQAAFVRRPAPVSASTEPQLADTIAPQRETSARSGTRFIEKECDDGRRLSAEREARIRQRVADGTYNSLDIADELARRLLRSADL